MPLYEYSCNDCGRQFERLSRSDEPPSCPACHGANLERLLSVFAVSTAGQSRETFPSAGPCGSCGDPRGPGACSMN